MHFSKAKVEGKSCCIVVFFSKIDDLRKLNKMESAVTIVTGNVDFVNIAFPHVCWFFHMYFNDSIGRHLVQIPKFRYYAPINEPSQPHWIQKYKININVSSYWITLLIEWAYLIVIILSVFIMFAIFCLVITPEVSFMWVICKSHFGIVGY